MIRSVLALTALQLVCCQRRPPPTAPVRAAADVTSSVSPPPWPPLADAATLTRCALSYACSLDHPGLGSISRSVTVDFATCTRRTESHSSSYESEEAPPRPIAPVAMTRSRSDRTAARTSDGGDAHEMQAAPSTLSAAACANLRTLTAAITAPDISEAQESAHVDTEACMLRLECASDPSRPPIQVQRQSLEGSGHVVELIRALYAAE